MRPLSLLSALLLAFAPVAQAEVTAVGDSGFVVHHGVDVTAEPAAVFQTMVGEVSAWWLSDHTWSGNSANLSIERHAGGCFCEQLPDGGSVEHLRVVHIQPGHLIRLQGGLGPLQEMGLNGAMTWTVSHHPDSGGSRIEWRYTVHGFLPDGFEEISAAVDQVLGLQLASLTARLTDG